MDGDRESYPKDKIFCEDNFTRYVVACMRNCEKPGYCNAFWDFFKQRGITPIEYTNINGIGELVMKRIVFDCDRCGKKDIGVPLTAFYTDGENEGQPIPTEDLKGMIQRFRPLQCSEQFIVNVMRLLKEELTWEHYCEPCFKKIVSGAGTIVGQRQKGPAKTSAQSAQAKALSQRKTAPSLITEEEAPEVKKAK
ncbi:MAG TPA: hypothetical protein PK329_01755 [Myxococcota bacterium]|nr:hypothetical protein [Myxococcota bacterium]HOS61169.1 hypothetical protein [Myxococcota bacterium]HPC92352.1 hypothetical protein [Myxococcota bacterium]HPL25744.1 hypothetical protein [Myxococcota bacterium]HQE72488.1 hypothetical protein [Myxococcota bacterium]